MVERQNQHDVLRHLGVGHALHATQHGIEDTTTEEISRPLVLLPSRKREKYAAPAPVVSPIALRRLSEMMSKHPTATTRAVLVSWRLPDEIGHGVGTKAAHVRGQQSGQQHVATRPAHDERGVHVAQPRSNQPPK